MDKRRESDRRTPNVFPGAREAVAACFNQHLNEPDDCADLGLRSSQPRTVRNDSASVPGGESPNRDSNGAGKPHSTPEG